SIPGMGFSQLVEWYILKQEKNFNEIAPEKPHNGEIKKRRMQTYKGAFVFEPKPGLYKDIVVFDFKSLYPSIISSHNISPGTLNCDCCPEKELAPAEDKNEKYWFCTKKKGFIPTIMEELIERRMRIKEIIKKEKKNPLLEARSQMLKLLANSFYGYIGFYAARWYSIECARAITSYGRYYIHKVIDRAKEAGFNVLYSDTDSVFLALDGKTKKDSEKFAEEINLELPGVMELNFEAFYPSGIFVSAKAGAYGAKKKYALLKEDGNLKVRGFEAVRRNWSPIAKEVQVNVLNIILKENDSAKAFDYVKKIIKELNEHKIPIDKVIIHTQLQKEIASYDAIGPHVAIATRMKEKGMPVGPGSIIEYVITKHGEKIRDKAKFPSEVNQKDYDPSYYADNQIIPAVEKIFEVLGYSKEELAARHDQDKLDKFFK
ncbi:DNA polymerase, partial [Candidatus Babeliales bacterium]|nr:DNA polymerase [Candidatus Babeliales bacterium]